MKRQHIGFVIVVIILVGVVGGLIGYQEWLLRGKDTFILATRPVDPRDLFRGEYVILRYEIETSEIIRQYNFDASVRQAVYVQLKTSDKGIASIVSVAQSPDSNGIWMKGDYSENRIRFPNLEQYYVPEGSGLPVERLGDDLYVRVVVRNNEPRIVELLDAELNVINPRDYLER